VERFFFPFSGVYAFLLRSDGDAILFFLERDNRHHHFFFPANQINYTSSSFFFSFPTNERFLFAFSEHAIFSTFFLRRDKVRALL